MKGRNVYFATVFSKELEKWKKENHKTQEDFAEKIHVNKNMITRYKTGEAYPESSISLICKVLGVDESIFYLDTPEKKILFDEEYRMQICSEVIDDELEIVQENGIDIGFWKFFISIDNIYDMFPFEFPGQWKPDMIQGNKNSKGQKTGFTKNDLLFVKQLQHEAETTVSVLMIKELIKNGRKDGE